MTTASTFTPLPSPVRATWDMQRAHCTLHLAETMHAQPVPVVHYIQPGLRLLSHRIFRQRVPTPQQIEQAIMVTEDALRPLARLLPADMRLLSSHPLLHQITQHLPPPDARPDPDSLMPAPPQQHLPHDGVHALLQRRLAQDPALPRDAQWTAALVLSYEVLHHWGLPWMELVHASAAPMPARAAH